MRLIHRVEVAYFRSIYKEQIFDCSDTNVIFGRNDSGKSNLLRALNLFFNNQTNPGLPFLFGRDLSHSRRAEAEADAAANVRKFVYVKIWFQTPANWRASLGDDFWVKKQWSLTQQATSSSITEQRLQQYLTRFLNKVRFHYVPAIKDRRIFENLQASIYKVVSAHNEFSGSLGEFANALRARTLELSDGLLDRLGISSVVSTPQDLTDLFRSLDFETTSEAGDAYSLTLQRGDGIQVRHIPPILAFISDKSPEDYHVWGFEEPENSLELALAIKEAETFRAFGQQWNKQMFLTSHSPAFFSLKDADVSRYFVSRTEPRAGRLTSIVRKIDSGIGTSVGELMGETPHLPVISEYLRQAHEQIEKNNEARAALEVELAVKDQSVLFVEGETDKLILAKAWEVIIGTALPFAIEAGGGTTKMHSLGIDGPVLNRLAPERKLMALVDNDTEGRALYKNGRLDAADRWVRHNSNGVHWRRLPISTGLHDLMTQLQIDPSAWPGCLENLFSPEIRREAEERGALALSTGPHAELVQPKYLQALLPYLAPRDDLLHYFILATAAEAKVNFAHFVVEIAGDRPEIFEPLRPALEDLNRLLAGNM